MPHITATLADHSSKETGGMRDACDTTLAGSWLALSAPRVLSAEPHQNAYTSPRSAPQISIRLSLASG